MAKQSRFESHRPNRCAGKRSPLALQLGTREIRLINGAILVLVGEYSPGLTSGLLSRKFSISARRGGWIEGRNELIVKVLRYYKKKVQYEPRSNARMYGCFGYYESKLSYGGEEYDIRHLLEDPLASGPGWYVDVHFRDTTILKPAKRLAIRPKASACYWHV